MDKRTLFKVMDSFSSKIQDLKVSLGLKLLYESFATVGEIRVWWRADLQSGSRVLKKVF